MLRGCLANKPTKPGEKCDLSVHDSRQIPPKPRARDRSELGDHCLERARIFFFFITNPLEKLVTDTNPLIGLHDICAYNFNNNHESNFKRERYSSKYLRLLL